MKFTMIAATVFFFYGFAKSHFTAGFLLGAVLILSSVDGQEVIDTANLSRGLSNRGIAFQAPASDWFSEIFYATGVGDVDGDGYGDLLFSMRDCPSAGSDGQPVMLIFGKPGLAGKVSLCDSSLRTAIFRINGSQSDQAQVAPVGDVIHNPSGDFNGDGHSDFFFGYPSSNMAFLVYGTSQLEGNKRAEDVGSTIPGMNFWSSDPLDGGIGISMADIGDINGDGEEDLAFGAPSSRPDGRASAGKVFIVLGARHSGPSIDLALVGNSIPGIQLIGGQVRLNLDSPSLIGEAIGAHVRGVGDIDGDGFDDLLVGTWIDRMYLVRGSPNFSNEIDFNEIVKGNAIPGVTLFKYPENILWASFGADIGDLAGDEFPDLLFGAPGQQSLSTGIRSASYLIQGRLEWPSEIHFSDPSPETVKFLEYQRGSAFGVSVAGVGDLNDDEVPDFVIGAHRASASGFDTAGEVYAIYGSRDFKPEVDLSQGFSGIRVIGECDVCMLGMQVAPAWDFNGDKVPDFIMTNSRAIADLDSEDLFSRAYLIYGPGDKPQPLGLQYIDPAWGPIRGGTEVEITGTGFGGAPRLHFGSLPATEVKVRSLWQIRATTPPGTALGLVDVKLEIGGDAATIPGGFEYIPNYPLVDLNALDAISSYLWSPRTMGLGGSDTMTFGDLDGDAIDDLILGTVHEKALMVPVIKSGHELPARLEAYVASNITTLISKPNLVRGVLIHTSVVGDVNGDGIQDLGIERNEDVGYLIFGRKVLPAELDMEDEVAAGRAVRLVPGKLIPGQQLTGGVMIIPVGDLTADGIDDFAVGMSYDKGVIVYVQGQRTFPAEVDLSNSELVFCRIHGSLPGQQINCQALAGDVNGDGVPDILGYAGQGSGDIFIDLEAFLIYGSRQMPFDVDVESYVNAGGGVALKMPIPSPQGSLFNILTVAAPGDVNGDRFADILIGQFGGGRSRQGENYLIFGGSQLPHRMDVVEDVKATDGIVRILGPASERAAGQVAAAGDFNGDGLQDFLVNEAPTYPGGSSFLIFGRKQLPGVIDLAHLGGLGIQIHHPHGSRITSNGLVGDLDGDGRTDFAIAVVPFDSPDEPSLEERRLYIIYGGYGEKRFLRGDANRDGAVDISDAVTIISFFFIGGETPACQDAVDVNDSGTIDLSDAIYLLGSLFLGQPAPLAPFPDAGQDPTPDDLDCLKSAP
jgi:IPT/TIG domain-containing protein/FG-GAP repeat protein/dockerin type I repeat protein